LAAAASGSGPAIARAPRGAGSERVGYLRNRPTAQIHAARRPVSLRLDAVRGTEKSDVLSLRVGPVP
jgi:hypothetical protein